MVTGDATLAKEGDSAVRASGRAPSSTAKPRHTGRLRQNAATGTRVAADFVLDVPRAHHVVRHLGHRLHRAHPARSGPDGVDGTDDCQHPASFLFGPPDSRHRDFRRSGLHSNIRVADGRSPQSSISTTTTDFYSSGVIGFTNFLDASDAGVAGLIDASTDFALCGAEALKFPPFDGATTEVVVFVSNRGLPGGASDFFNDQGPGAGTSRRPSGP